MVVFLVIWISTIGFGQGGGVAIQEMPNMHVCKQVQKQIMSKEDWMGLQWNSGAPYKERSTKDGLGRSQLPVIGTKCIGVE